jgi:hypothetical protein
VLGKVPVWGKGKNCYQDIVGDLFGVNSRGMGKFLEVSEECCDRMISGGRLLDVGVGGGGKENDGVEECVIGVSCL